MQMLIDIVLEYNLRQVRNMLDQKREGQIIWFGDDLGTQHALPISPEKWRQYLKPCFKAIYDLVHDRGLFGVHAYRRVHTRDHSRPCGLRSKRGSIRRFVRTGLDNLVRVCKGKVCIDLDLDRQMFPFCKPEEIDKHVEECVKAMAMPEGGLWLEAECAPDVPLENIEAICAAMDEYRSYLR